MDIPGIFTSFMSKDQDLGLGDFYSLEGVMYTLRLLLILKYKA